jgi:hypothetical protein
MIRSRAANFLSATVPQLCPALLLLVVSQMLPHSRALAGVGVPLVRLSGPAVGTATASNTLPGFGGGVANLQTNLPADLAGGDVNSIVGATTFYANGFTGQGTITANVEAGHVWSGHETLPHVSQFVHDPGAWNDPGTVGAQQSDLYDRHATWVGMHIGGRNGGATQGTHQTGIAPNTDLKSGALASGWTGSAFATGFNFTANSFTIPYAAYFGTTDVINSSWGNSGDTFGSTGFAIAMDGLANQFPRTTFVTAAGNDADPDHNPNTPPFTNTIGSPGSGYNSITVGALQNDGVNGYSAVANFSSRGPQDFAFVDFSLGGVLVGCRACRAAVDIAAPGTNLTTAYYGGATGGNNSTLAGSPNGPAGSPDSYSFAVAGTSFASPIVAGAAALVDSASYNTPALAANPASRDARVVKAVLLNGATKIPGWNNGQFPNANGFGGVVTSQSLDYDSGAGALNLTQTYSQYINAGTRDVPGTPAGNQGPVDNVGWDLGQVVAGTDNIYPISQTLAGGTLMTVTLDWFRERFFDTASLTVFENAQADLDLIVRDTLTNNVISASVSALNNTEHLHFLLPRTSKYQIEVNFFGTIFNFLGPNYNAEQYGLAWTAVAVPEPASALLMVAGLLIVAKRRRGESSEGESPSASIPATFRVR